MSHRVGYPCLPWEDVNPCDSTIEVSVKSVGGNMLGKSGEKNLKCEQIQRMISCREIEMCEMSSVIGR